ncbi:hypothetical protein LTR94_035496, partial [Friedmanniomyces endolithicus]
MIDRLGDAAGVGADRLQPGRASQVQRGAAALDLGPDLFRRLVQQVADPHVAQGQLHLARVDQGVDVLIIGKVAEGLAAAEALTIFAQEQGLARLSIDDGMGAEARWEPEPVT